MPERCTRHLLTARDGTRVAYHTHLGTQVGEEALADRRTVLLTNGVGTSENFWRFLVADLEGDHRVVHWNYRGHGSSESAPTGDYSLDAHVDDLMRVTLAVMARGDGRPPHHVGFSMGVRVVLELYRRRPELVPSMTLIAGSPRAPGMGSPLLRVPGALRGLKTLMAAASPLVPVLAPAVHALLASPLAVPSARAVGLVRARAERPDVDAFIDAVRRMDLRAFYGSVRGLLEGDSSDVLPTVRVPTQVIAAANDTLVSLAEMQRMHAAIPGATWLRVEDAGHAGLVEAGLEMAVAVRGFLRTLAPERAPPRKRGRRRTAKVVPLRPEGTPPDGEPPTVH